jgi:hypothetical protein
MTPAQVDALSDVDFDAMLRLMRAEAAAMEAQSRKAARTR